MRDLRRIKIDTIIHYNMQCSGGIRLVPDKGCSPWDIQYLVWSDHGVQFMQRFDECKEYPAVSTKRYFLDLIVGNYLKIKRESIKPPQYIAMYEGKKQVFTQSVDHTCLWIFKINTGKHSITKTIDSFDLDKEYIDNKTKQRNINYYYNQRSVLKKLTAEIDKVVEKYNKEMKTD